MPINKTLTLEATGGEASYHIVRSINLDYVAKATSAVVMSYVSAEAHVAGKQPASFEMIPVPLDGLPDKGQEPLDFVEAALVVAAPADISGAGRNRYLFSGGTIVA
jgi:hypothetical protein